MMQLHNLETSDVGISNHVISHNSQPSLHPPPPSLQSDIPPSSYRTKPGHPMPGGACWLACTALGGVSAVEFLEPDDSAQRPQSSPNLPPNLESQAFFVSATVASLQSEGKHDEYGGSSPLGHVPLRRRPWHSSPLRCHYRRATVVSPQDCPRVPRAATRRRCRPSNMHRCTRRKRAVDWPGAKGSHAQRLLFCSR
jgi:hypothetical protein